MTFKKHIIRIIIPLIFIAISYFNPSLLIAQNTNFPLEILLKSDSISGFSGLHSFAWGQSNGKILLVGGRPDGIHARQPFNAFPASQNNHGVVL